MGVLSNLFSKKKITPTVLIDIGSTSVAGACALFAEGEMPSILFTRRLPIEAQTDEDPKRAMLRALTVLVNALVRDGAPAMHRTTGSGTVRSVRVSIDAPWEKTELRTIHLEQDEPFVFTKVLVKAALEHHREKEDPGTVLEEHVVGITLNGYPTAKPFGQSAHRASLVVLSSSITQSVAEEITELLKAAYHTGNITCASGTSLRLQSLRSLFPHEKEAIFLDTNATDTSLAILRDGLLVALSTTASTPSWTESVRKELEKFAEQFPLPRTILLLPREEVCATKDCADLRAELRSLATGKLWLSQSPPKIIPILSAQCSSLVRHEALTLPDTSLILMAHYWGNSSREEY